MFGVRNWASQSLSSVANEAEQTVQQQIVTIAGWFIFVCWFKMQEGLPEGGYSYQHPSILCLEHVWSGANGATANCHDSRMIYICLFVCWFKMQEVFPEGGYSVPLNIIFRTYVKWSKRCNSWIDRAKLGREEQTTGQDVWFWWNRERRSKSLAQSTSVQFMNGSSPN